MFDPVPELLAIAGDSSSQMFEAFAAHCVDSRLPMDWRLHIDLLRWLEESLWRKRIDESTNGPEIWLGFLIASCGAWARQDRSRFRAIAALDTVRGRVGAVAVKRSDFRRPADLFLYEFSAPRAKGITVAIAETLDGVQDVEFRICE